MAERIICCIYALEKINDACTIERSVRVYMYEDVCSNFFIAYVIDNRVVVRVLVRELQRTVICAVIWCGDKRIVCCIYALEDEAMDAQ